MMLEWMGSSVMTELLMVVQTTAAKAMKAVAEPSVVVQAMAAEVTVEVTVMAGMGMATATTAAEMTEI